jgi:hypothetical protein
MHGQILYRIGILLKCVAYSEAGVVVSVADFAARRKDSSDI